MIILADYIGHCDKNKKPIGHPVKVISELAELLLPVADVGAAASGMHLAEIQNKSRMKVIELPESVCVFSRDRIKNFVRKWRNLKVLFSKGEDTIWFINVDFSLFLNLYIFGKRKHRIWINLCSNPLKGAKGCRKKIMTKVLEAADLVVVTNRNFMESVPGRTVFIPDYYYRPDIYSGYLTDRKEERIVCLGTMGDTKLLEELVKYSEEFPYPVYIIGNFSQNPQRFEKLQEMAENNRNIHLENKYVGNREYYKLIAESKYVILPYDMNLYDERTSGILLESIFLNSIPIAPEKLLDYNSIAGIGYSDISEIPEAVAKSDEKMIQKTNEELKNTVFSMAEIQKKAAAFYEETSSGADKD